MQIAYATRDLLEPRVREGHLLLAVLARRVRRDVAHRPWPVESDERDQVLELGRLDQPGAPRASRTTRTGTPGRLAGRKHGVRRAVVERERSDVEPARQLHGLVDHVQVAQAEEVHLQQAELDDVVHPELGHDFPVGALLLEGTTSISGPAPITTPAAGSSPLA